MDGAVAYFLDLRLRVRGNPEALALVDRCLQLVTRAVDADPPTLAVLERDVEILREELEARFGRRAFVRH